MDYAWPGGPSRCKADWNARRSEQVLTKYESLAFTLSLGTFLLYFLYLREPSNIDEDMSQPIWKRVPGIDPDQAKQMMEVDRYLGLQVDYSELEKYRQEYYEKKLSELEREKKEEQKHRRLRQAAHSHTDMLQQYAQKQDFKEE